MQPLFKETNRLRIVRRFIAGYACLVFGLFGLMDMLARNVLGLGKTAQFNLLDLILFVCLMVAGGCNVLDTRIRK